MSHGIEDVVGSVIALRAELTSIGEDRGGDPQHLRERVRAIRAFLDRTASPSLVESLCAAGDPLAIGEQLANVEHVGFIAPPGTSHEAVVEAAHGAGFDRDHQFFQSIVVASELGALTGTGDVPTTIFRAFGHPTAHRRVGIEIFFPTAEDDALSEWVRGGVCSHIALEVKGKGHEPFMSLVPLFEAACFRIPAFFREYPVVIPQPDGTVFRTLYLDGRVEDRVMRLELFSFS